MISLTGVCRFEVEAELPFDRPYRRVQANWQKFHADLTPDEAAADIKRARLMSVLQNYFKLQNIDADCPAPTTNLSTGNRYSWHVSVNTPVTSRLQQARL